ncbi:MAG TPA: ribonuclease HIII [Verrucomicrobiales bacterium]|jgi:ribonuclease HIII|nr:ribonuclease HIII [Verrucomicrobiales bacterium]HIL68272.1 ribonuclease HIII [Verrucomicrobiota bacterium]
MPEITSHTIKISAEQSDQLKDLLTKRNYEFREVPYARYAAKGGKVNVVSYQSGKLVIQGKSTREFIEFTLEPEILKEATLGYEDVLTPLDGTARLGIDESGKGDFFGPMCIAGVYANESVIKQFIDAGIKDSKKISSDRKMAELAERIRSIRGCVYQVVPIGNEAYNRLYLQMKSVNGILAWGHARTIENLLLRKYQMDPPPLRVISDQFAASKAVISKALMSLGKEVELVQRHKAESDPVVAAASILARDEFVRRLKTLGDQTGVVLPKGASRKVDETAKALFEEKGKEVFNSIAKIHFRTWFRAVGLPEPPKTVWKRSKSQ